MNRRSEPVVSRIEHRHHRYVREAHHRHDVAIANLRAITLIHWSLNRYGYDLQPEDFSSERLFFVRETRGEPTHHLSACEPASEFWTGHLAFRDRLRADSQLAAEYLELKHLELKHLELKRLLCLRYSDDRASYTAGKEDFIAAVLRS